MEIADTLTDSQVITEQKSKSQNQESINSQEKIELKSLGQYARELTQVLPKNLLKREPMRLKWLVFFYASIAAIIYAQLSLELIWPVRLLLAVAMGTFVSSAGLFAHELFHGSIVANKTVQNILGQIGLAPYLVSPTYWKFWHNQLHHGNTQLLYKDPDAFPTRSIWKRSAFMKTILPLTPGSGHPLSFLYLFYWFPFQATLNQVYMRFNNKMWDKMNHTRVTIEFIIQCVLITTYIYFIGSQNWLFLVIIPFMVQNYTAMSYISTNHNLSPYTKINDPLVNSLTVTNNPILEAIHLNFGYHTEHHIFPTMPMSRAKLVSQKLKELYPERYMIMPKFQALKKLYTTPRLYKDRYTLVDPKTEKEYQTLGSEKLH